MDERKRLLKKHDKIVDKQFLIGFLEKGYFKIIKDTSNRGYYRLSKGMFPFSNNEKVYHFNIFNSSRITNNKILSIVDELANEFENGFCYSNSDKLTTALNEHGFEAHLFSGWLFMNEFFEFPIHHAWVAVIDEGILKIIDTSVKSNEKKVYDEIDYNDPGWRKKNLKKIIAAEEEARKNLSNFCLMGEVPSNAYWYVGTMDDISSAKNTFNSLRMKYPNHPSYANIVEDDSTELQLLIKNKKNKEG